MVLERNEWIQGPGLEKEAGNYIHGGRGSDGGNEGRGRPRCQAAAPRGWRCPAGQPSLGATEEGAPR